MSNRTIAANDPPSVLPAAGLLALALVGAGLAGMSLPLGRLDIAALLAAGAGVTAIGVGVWLAAPSRSIPASVVALAGLIMMMVAGGMVQ